MQPIMQEDTNNNNSQKRISGNFLVKAKEDLENFGNGGMSSTYTYTVAYRPKHTKL